LIVENEYVDELLMAKLIDSQPCVAADGGERPSPAGSSG
jgi:hypothetical protein